MTEPYRHGGNVIHANQHIDKHKVSPRSIRVERSNGFRILGRECEDYFRKIAIRSQIRRS